MVPDTWVETVTDDTGFTVPVVVMREKISPISTSASRKGNTFFASSAEMSRLVSEESPPRTEPTLLSTSAGSYQNSPAPPAPNRTSTRATIQETRFIAVAPLPSRWLHPSH